ARAAPTRAGSARRAASTAGGATSTASWGTVAPAPISRSRRRGRGGAPHGGPPLLLGERRVQPAGGRWRQHRSAAPDGGGGRRHQLGCRRRRRVPHVRAPNRWAALLAGGRLRGAARRRRCGRPAAVPEAGRGNATDWLSVTAGGYHTCARRV